MGFLMAPAKRAGRPAGLIEGAALAAYAVWLIALGLHHEPWFDEMQVWLLARENSLTMLLGHYVRYEGTPGLWHALVWIAVRLGLPVGAMWMLSAALCLAGAAVIVTRAPFPLALRLGLLLTYFYGYQFSVLSRSYALDMVLVPLAALWFADRVRRPLRYALVVGLIANVNAFSFVAAGLLGLEWLVRLAQARRLVDRRALGALALAGALGLFALWCAWQPADNAFLEQANQSRKAIDCVIYVAMALFDRVTPGSGAAQSGLDALGGMALSLVLLGLIVRLVWAGRDRAVMLAIPLALIGFALMHSSPWHSGVLFAFVLFMVWTQWGNAVGRRSRAALIAMLALLEAMQGIQTLRTAAMDWTGNYSAGRPAAAAVMAWRAAHPGGRIVAFGGQAAEVEPYLPENVFANFHDGVPHPQFTTWQRGESFHGLPRPAEWAAQLAARPDAVLASVYWLPGPVKRDPAALACRMGYDLTRRFAATMPWRGMAIDNSLLLFERATREPCAH